MAFRVHLTVLRLKVLVNIINHIFLQRMTQEDAKTGVASQGKLEAELTGLTLQLLTLSQDLVTAKLRLETLTKQGWLLLAKARYVSTGGVSMTQVPTSDMVARVRVERSECSVTDNSVRYHHHNIVTDTEPSSPDNEGVRRRTKEQEQESDKVTPSKSKDPLKWFGLLSPPALKQSQVEMK